jgi:D-alanyl-D-alanine carboxypeptidase (penicillin-binding protein 5/6)
MLPPSLTRVQIFAVASALLITALPAVAAQPPAPAAAAAPASVLPTVQAQTWALYDPVAGKMLASHEADKRIIPASLTKVLTAYIVCEALHDKRLQDEQKVNVSLNAYRVDKDSSKMYIDPKVPVSIKDLLYGLIIQSGNDAAVQLAEAVSGTEEAFASVMNKKASELGMKASHFENASGLPGAQHYSTSEDLAVLAARVIKDYPEEYKIYAIKNWAYNNINQGNRNLLLYSDPSVDGMKTGHVKESGYNLIASAKRPSGASDYRLIAVVTGSASPKARAADAEKLLSWGYANFENVKLVGKDAVVGTPVVWKGLQKTIKAGYAEDRYETVAKGTGSGFKTDVVMNEKLMAPLAKGAKIGVAKVSYNGKPVSEIPVVALEEVQQSGFFARLIDTVRLWFV